MKKVLYIIITLLLAISVLSITCFAAEDGESADVAASEDVAADGGADATGEEPEAEWTLTAFFGKYANTILSIVSTVVVGVIAVLFKGFLIPSVKSGMSHILDGTSKTNKLNEDMLARLQGQIESINNAVVSMGALSADVQSAKGATDKQQEMLYLILMILKEGFSSAKLPEYTKNRINLAIDKMTQHMSCGVGDNGDEVQS